MNEDKDRGLKICFEMWSLMKTNQINTGKSLHLADKVLYQMALPGAIRDGDPKETEHLSLCPFCLKKWAVFRKSLSDIEDARDYEEKRIVAWGMLEAASSGKSMEPLRIKSSCGQFILGLFPQVGDPERGMITLELGLPADLNLEGRKATVRDYKGRIILQGVIIQGTIARKIEKVSDLNLTRWTVTVE